MRSILFPRAFSRRLVLIVSPSKAGYQEFTLTHSDARRIVILRKSALALCAKTTNATDLHLDTIKNNIDLKSLIKAADFFLINVI